MPRLRAHDHSAAATHASRPTPMQRHNRQAPRGPRSHDADRRDEARDMLIVTSDASDASPTTAPSRANDVKDKIDTGRRRPCERGSHEPRWNIGCRQSASRGKLRTVCRSIAVCVGSRFFIGVQFWRVTVRTRCTREGAQRCFTIADLFATRRAKSSRNHGRQHSGRANRRQSAK
jgi:hypothetical protein